MWYSYNTFSSLGLCNPRASFQTPKAKSVSACGWCAQIKNSVRDEWFSVACLSSKMQMIAFCMKVMRGWHGASAAPFGSGRCGPSTVQLWGVASGLSLCRAPWLGESRSLQGIGRQHPLPFHSALYCLLADPTEEPARIVKVGMI